MPPFDKLHVTILTHLFTRTTDFATLSHFNDFAAATALLSSFFEALTHQGMICIILLKKQVFFKDFLLQLQIGRCKIQLSIVAFYSHAYARTAIRGLCGDDADKAPVAK